MCLCASVITIHNRAATTACAYFCTLEASVLPGVQRS